MRLVKGQRYAADVTLGWLEKIASNDTIKKKFEDLGFAFVAVDGSGKARAASGVWTGDTGDVDIADSHLSNIRLA
jgi:hypothetical protein